MWGGRTLTSFLRSKAEMGGDLAAFATFVEKIHNLEQDHTQFSDQERAWLKVLNNTYRRYQSRIAKADSYVLSCEALFLGMAEGQEIQPETACRKAHRELLDPPPRCLSIDADPSMEPVAPAEEGEDREVMEALSKLDAVDERLLRETCMGSKKTRAAQLAIELGTTVQAVWQRISRAKDKFKEIYKRQQKEANEEF